MAELPEGFEILDEPEFKLWGPGRIPVLVSCRNQGKPRAEVLVEVSVDRLPSNTEFHGTRLMRGKLDVGDIFVTVDELLEDVPPVKDFNDEICRASIAAATLIANHPKGATK